MTETNESLPEALKTTPVPEKKAEEVIAPPVEKPEGEESLEDEALELEERLPDVPHLQNPDRIAAARTAI
ncbi:hypothetical protein HC823_02350, partial [Candidatus Gracilibacteria bacterium]|nr:hypothetical protein [Candidatus Gracilibacteria bacterium]